MSPLSLGTPPLVDGPSAAWSRVDWGVGVGTDASALLSGLEHGEALVRIERPRFDEITLVGLAAQLLHVSGQHVPVEHLLLSRSLDGSQRRLAPRLVVADPERLVESPVGVDVGVELMVLVGEKRMRPARGGDEGRAPG